jgi:hypothetical protein
LGNIGRHGLGHRPTGLFATSGAVLPAALLAKSLAHVDVASSIGDQGGALAGVGLTAVHRQGSGDHGGTIRVDGQVVGHAAGADRLGLLGIADEPDLSVRAPCDSGEDDVRFPGG